MTINCLVRLKPAYVPGDTRMVLPADAAVMAAAMVEYSVGTHRIAAWLQSPVTGVEGVGVFVAAAGGLVGVIVADAELVGVAVTGVGVLP